MVEILALYIAFYLWVGLPFLYFHRDLTHNVVTFSKPLIYLVKLIRWCSEKSYSQMKESSWVVDHRNHHKYADTNKDPYRPYTWGSWEANKVFIPTKDLLDQTKNLNVINNSFDRFLEKYPYGRYLLLAILVATMSWPGLIFWIVLQSRIYFEYFYHALHHSGLGYGKDSRSNAKNLMPIGIFLAGEELHANHHNYTNRANLAMKWFEIDTGYLLLKFLSYFNLVKFNK